VIATFKKWFSKKTECEWDNRHNFQPVPGYYNFNELSTKQSQSTKTAVAAAAAASAAGSRRISDSTPCLLPTKVASLVEMLFDEDTALTSVKNAGVQVSDEFDLASVTSDRIIRARDLLQQIDALMESKPALVATGLLDAAKAHAVDLQVWAARVEAASNHFNTVIPAVVPVLINSADLVAEKMHGARFLPWILPC
jgi:hypothetical protein